MKSFCNCTEIHLVDCTIIIKYSWMAVWDSLMPSIMKRQFYLFWNFCLLHVDNVFIVLFLLICLLFPDDIDVYWVVVWLRCPCMWKPNLLNSMKKNFDFMLMCHGIEYFGSCFLILGSPVVAKWEFYWLMVCLQAINWTDAYGNSWLVIAILGYMC